jgi:murein DD-endopeptidase MepM/ murein hydrolase activator NlpD
MLIRLLGAPLGIVLILAIASASAVTQKSTLTWPVAAPTRVAAKASDYRASGWMVSSPFGWRPNPEQLGTWELHEGADLAGPMFCMGCKAPPLGDVEIAQVGWDQEWSI